MQKKKIYVDPKMQGICPVGMLYYYMSLSFFFAKLIKRKDVLIRKKNCVAECARLNEEKKER